MIQAYSYNLIFGLFLRGRVDEARAVLERILTISTSRELHAPFQLGLIDIGVLIEMLAGNVDAARRLADVVADVPHSVGPLPGMGAATSRVQLGLDGSVARARDTTQGRIANRQLLSAAFLGVLSNIEQQADAGLAAALTAATADAQSPMLRSVADYIAADADADAARLLEVGERFHDLGSTLLAVASRARAATHRFNDGNRADAFRIAHITWAGAETLGSVRAGLFAPFSNRIGLSQREVEVIRAGAGGRSNRDIAEVLGLSQRTVENHLHAVYQKTGTNDRAEVTRACTTWLRAATTTPEGEPE
jgi:DNA-binding NarL/FixJ family response regulator